MSDVESLFKEQHNRRGDAEALDFMRKYATPREQPTTEGQPPQQPPQEQSQPETESDADALAFMEKYAAPQETPLIGGPAETAGAVVNGVIKAVNETSDMMFEAKKWVDETVIDLPSITMFEDGKLIGLENKNQQTNILRLPEVFEPKSVSGKMVSSLSQFLTGFAGAGKIVPLAKGAKLTTQTINAATRGAVADFAVFDEHEDRLSNLIQSVPALENPVTEFLAADPDDGFAEGRLKNALEGVGMGVIVDGIGLALKTMKQARVARAIDIDARMKTEPHKFTMEDAKDLFGEGTDPSEGAVRTAVIKNDNGDEEIFINWARIDSDNDVKEAMQALADADAQGINKARRGTVTHKRTKLNADQVQAWELMREDSPVVLKAEEQLALRQLWAESGERLKKLAMAAELSDDPKVHFAFRKMVAVHGAIQRRAIQTRTETARALNQWAIPAGGDAERFELMGNILSDAGGRGASKELAKRISKLARTGNSSTDLARFMDKLGSHTNLTMDFIRTAWVNGLLSGPKTHMVNMMSNTTVSFLRVAERKGAQVIGDVIGDGTGIERGEAGAMFAGMLGGYKDGIRYMGKTLRTGQIGFGTSKIEAGVRQPIFTGDSTMSRMARMGEAIVGVPGRLLAAEDELFKTVGYRSELHAQAFRQANREVMQGKISPDSFKSRMHDIIENPPEDIKLLAIDQATYNTFQRKIDGPVVQFFENARSSRPSLTYIMPFIRTPANILNFSFSRTPLMLLNKTFYEKMATGGASRELVLSELAIGTSVMAITTDLALNGQITGRGPESGAERNTYFRSGARPYSVKIGDMYIPYNRLDPLGMMMGVAADLTEMSLNMEHEAEDKTLDELVAGFALALSNNMVNKTYMSGVADLMEAISDPKRYGDSLVQKYAGTLVPYSAAIGEATRFNDPVMRDVANFAEAVRKKIPGLSKDLPPVRDVWGRELSYQGPINRVFDLMSPIYVSQYDPEPIDQEFIDQDFGVTKPRAQFSVNGVRFDIKRHPKAYSRYLELSGNELKLFDGKGAKDFLNDVVTGKSVEYSPAYEELQDGEGGTKHKWIKAVIGAYRERAQLQLIEEFEELKAAYDDGLKEQDAQ